MPYDTLVYALGSGAAPAGAPGAEQHACSVVGEREATRTRERLAALRRGSVVVVGGGLTGIETAAEVAEARPDLDVHLVSSAAPGHWLSPAARRALHRAFARLRVTTHLGRVERVTRAAVDLDDGRTLAADLAIWTAGFAVPALAREAGIEVDGAGRIVVDDTLRSVSHPEILAVGDAATATAAWGRQSRMSCQTALPMGVHAAAVIARTAAGRRAAPHRIRYVWQNISLGRRDGITQFTRADDRPLPFVLTGRVSARFKELVSSGAAWYAALRRPRAVGDGRS